MFSQLQPNRTRVILLRHGQSSYNALGLYQGSSDRPILTDLGRQQARLTGALLKNIPFDAIYCSPLKRAKETAEEVLRARCDRTIDPQNIQILPHLRETDLPLWQGLPFQQVREQFPQAYRCWKERPHEFSMAVPLESQQTNFTPQNSVKLETKLDFFPALDIYDRASKFWQEILPRHIGQTLLVVSHGGTNRALVSTALGISPACYHSIEQSNCALSILNFPKSCLDFATLEALNHTNHVGEKIPNSKDGLRLLLIPAASKNPKQIQHLARLLASEAIDFSISNDLDNCEEITQAILQNHPMTVRLQVSSENFPELWQQTMKARNRQPSDRTMTGLVVASDRILHRFLGQIFHLNGDRLSCLPLRSGTLTVIHHPNSNHPPILQTMNLSKL